MRNASASTNLGLDFTLPTVGNHGGQKMISQWQFGSRARWSGLAGLCLLFFSGGCLTPHFGEAIVPQMFAPLEPTFKVAVISAKFYNEQHHWPNNASELAAFATSDGNINFDPAEFQKLSFETRTNGDLHVDFAWINATNRASASGSFTINASNLNYTVQENPVSK